MPWHAPFTHQSGSPPLQLGMVSRLQAEIRELMAAKELLQAAKDVELTELEQLKRERSVLIEQLAVAERDKGSAASNSIGQDPE